MTVSQTDRQTHRQTDHGMCEICRNRLHLWHAAMWPITCVLNNNSCDMTLLVEVIKIPCIISQCNNEWPAEMSIKCNDGWLPL